MPSLDGCQLRLPRLVQEIDNLPEALISDKRRISFLGGLDGRMMQQILNMGNRGTSAANQITILHIECTVLL